MPSCKYGRARTKNVAFLIQGLRGGPCLRLPFAAHACGKGISGSFGPPRWFTYQPTHSHRLAHAHYHSPHSSFPTLLGLTFRLKSQCRGGASTAAASWHAGRSGRVHASPCLPGLISGVSIDSRYLPCIEFLGVPRPHS